ncbi:DsbA family protein [Pseudoruegeria sp. SK021]|uniref:DsbA family protein n=1 Tax=Pseudoruegeria sp. SK021 TaxID=1933035 RepID=UPI000A250ED3|nr:DsbA family protein [Pseudoruegeria sp. SK021]OSP55072.1 thiol-disulfide oxidoreductase [Pseudoruegeria sp. SK021]
MIRTFFAVGLLGAAFVVGAAGLAPAQWGGSAAAQTAEPATKSVAEMSLGDPDAPVTIIEYASFTCPHCANFHDTVFKELKKNYIDTGKVHFIHREVFFDRYGLWASMVARCGGEDRYFGIADMVYDTQKAWTAGGDPATIVGNLRRIGLTAGLSDEQLDVCLGDADTAQSLVAWYQENAEADNVTSTPSFFVNGEAYSNMSYADFSKVIDEDLAK